MSLTDTHVHFDAWETQAALEAVLDRASGAGVARMVAVGGSGPANTRAVALARRFPGRLYAAVGYDRDQAASSCPLDELESLAAAEEVVAVGEIGLDFHYHPETADAQRALMGDMLALARRRRLPAIVHSRDAETATLALLETHAACWPGKPGRIGVLHCFTGSAPFARNLLELGLAVSFSGILTFKKAEALRRVAAAIPDERLLIETDSPLLAPEPYRGRPNEPAYVRRVAEVLAEIRGCTPEAIAEMTTRNAQRLFGL
ncbi:MAG: TatD family hydrolase [Kiritimatiellae bacterium]|nr:TatD family hydrolase [Kiritimatiellia bacterium]